MTCDSPALSGPASNWVGWVIGTLGASEGKDGYGEEATDDLCGAVEGLIEAGDPSAGFKLAASAWSQLEWLFCWVSVGLGISALAKEHAHPSSAHLLQGDEPSITVHRF